MLEHQNEHFVRDILQFSHFVASESTFSYEFSCEHQNLLPQNRCFVPGFCQFSAHLTKCHACHGICTLSPREVALTMRFAKNTQHDSSKVLRLPRKIKTVTSKVLRLPRKLEFIDGIRRKSIAPATHNGLRHVTKHVWMSRSATLATRNEAMRHVKPPKTPVAELAIGTAIATSDGCERLSNVEHTLNPQTPRVKREPLLRIRKKTYVILWQKRQRISYRGATQPLRGKRIAASLALTNLKKTQSHCKTQYSVIWKTCIAKKTCSIGMRRHHFPKCKVAKRQWNIPIFCIPPSNDAPTSMSPYILFCSLVFEVWNISRGCIVECILYWLAIPNGHASILLPRKIILESGTSRKVRFS